MIVRMKKITLLMMHREVDASLKALRKLGLLHITQERGHPSSEALAEVKNQQGVLKKALNILPYETSPAIEEPVIRREVLDVAADILHLSEVRDRYRGEIEELEKKRSRLLPWGNFDPGDLDYLRNNGVAFHLVKLTEQDRSRIPDPGKLFVISGGKAATHAVWVGDELPGSLRERRVHLPDGSLNEINREIEKTRRRIRRIDEKLGEYRKERFRIEYGLQALEGEEEYYLRRAGIWEDDVICHVHGFIPDRDTRKIRALAARRGWGVVIREPSGDDPVPTLTENPKWIRIVQPVFNVLGTVPGYREFDISFLFLIFLSIFFAMIIGDAGYGFIFLLIALVTGGRQKGRNREPAILLGVMSVATILWGAVTGTWFGSRALANLPFLEMFKIEAISSFNDQSGELIKKITFMIGTVHLSIARLQKFIREFPDIRSYAQIGWWGMILGLYYLVLNIVLNPRLYTFTSLHMGLLLGGLAVVILFEEQRPGVHFFKGLLRGLLNLPLKFLDTVGAFSDIISYIRLFAVGLATVEIARSFNAMAHKMAVDTTGLILAVFVLIIGHALNIAMSALSVVVHGIRLKMLEFSGHLGMEWKGHSYHPFQEKKIIFKKE